jgi:hypothetical protein
MMLGIAGTFGAQRALWAALGLSLCGFVASILGGMLWLVISAKRMASTKTAPGLDLAIYVKHICIPIAVAVFIVAFLFLRRN